MGEDRFKPPSARVEDRPRGRGSAVKGVVLGLLADVGGTMVFGVVVSVVWGVVLAAAGRSGDEIQASFAGADDDPLLSTIFIAGGVLCSVLGGYVCERVARWGNYRVGAVLAALSLVVGFAIGAPARSAAMTLLMVFLTIGSVLLGTRLAFPERAAHR
jgi:hypothetical protein